MLLLNILLLILAATTAVAAIGGETRHKDEPRFFKSITRRGWVSLVCAVLTLAAGIGKEVKQQRENEQLRAVADEEKKKSAEDIKGLEGQVKAANTAQERNTELFIKSFSKLSGEVSSLQTQAKTEALQKKLATVEAELQKTQKALAPPPKAVLAFSFEPFINPPAAPAVPVTEVKLPVLADGSVRVEFTVLNISDVDAVDGEFTLQICEDCKFAKEPAGFRKLAGQSDKERYVKFQRILVRTALQTMTVDITVPPKYSGIVVQIVYRCRTCIVPEEPSKGIVRLVR
jgi:hypothetical protein